MTLQTDPPISLTQIQDEFLAPRGTPLSAFLRGGAWVPDISINAAVPTVLPISILDLLGSSLTEPTELLVMVSDINPDSMGEQTGYGQNGGGFGSLTPDTFRGVFVSTIRNNVNNDNLRIQIDQNGLPQDFFDDWLLVGPNWNVFLETSAATFDPNSGVGSEWLWDIVHVEFDVGSSYDITMAFSP